jgi:hypothetical protein
MSNHFSGYLNENGISRGLIYERKSSFFMDEESKDIFYVVGFFPEENWQTWKFEKWSMKFADKIETTEFGCYRSWSFKSQPTVTAASFDTWPITTFPNQTTTTRASKFNQHFAAGSPNQRVGDIFNCETGSILILRYRSCILCVLRVKSGICSCCVLLYGQGSLDRLHVWDGKSWWTAVIFLHKVVDQFQEGSRPKPSKWSPFFWQLIVKSGILIFVQS